MPASSPSRACSRRRGLWGRTGSSGSGWSGKVTTGARTCWSSPRVARPSPCRTRPFPSTLLSAPCPGQEFYALRRGGFFPVGFAFGTCTYYHVASYMTQWANQGGFFGPGARNMELTDYTQAVYTTRHAAQSRLADEAIRVGAEGVVGVTIEDYIRPYEVEINNQPRRDLLVEFTALGTAIVASGDDTLAIDYALPLTD